MRIKFSSNIRNNSKTCFNLKIIFDSPRGALNVVILFDLFFFNDWRRQHSKWCDFQFTINLMLSSAFLLFFFFIFCICWLYVVRTNENAKNEINCSEVWKGVNLHVNLYATHTHKCKWMFYGAVTTKSFTKSITIILYFRFDA